jgi:hypothetical protein
MRSVIEVRYFGHPPPEGFYLVLVFGLLIKRSWELRIIAIPMFHDRFSKV